MHCRLPDEHTITKISSQNLGTQNTTRDAIGTSVGLVSLYKIAHVPIYTYTHSQAADKSVVCPVLQSGDVLLGHDSILPDCCRLAIAAQAWVVMQSKCMPWKKDCCLIELPPGTAHLHPKQNHGSMDLLQHPSTQCSKFLLALYHSTCCEACAGHLLQLHLA